MSPEPESQDAPRSEGTPLCDKHQRPRCELPLSSGRFAEGHLPKKRQSASSLGYACAAVAVAAAASFVACGVWQAWALIDRAQGLARDPVATQPRRVAPSASTPRAAAEPTLSQPSPPALAAPRPPAMAQVTDGPHDDEAAPKEAPLLTASAAPSLRKATARAFEALAEASEKISPVGIEAVLDEPAGALTLGQPPPATYPRVDCKDIFVYIVMIAEGAPLRSSASIGVGKKGPARFRRPGQRVASWTVLAISDDWTGLNPRVWLEKDGTACRAELAGNPSRAHQTPKPPPRAKARRRRSRRR